jgi:hypothetical protein
VDVAHHRPVGQRVERLRAGVVELAQEAFDVERERRHPRRDLPLPELARPIPVDLDPVPVGIAEVDRLADEVVREPDDRLALARRMGEPAREVGALRHEQREVVEAGVPGRRPRARLLDQDEQLARARPERGAPVVDRERLQPQRVLVVVERAPEVGDAQLDRAEARARRDLADRRRRRLELLRIARSLAHLE